MTSTKGKYMYRANFPLLHGISIKLSGLSTDGLPGTDTEATTAVDDPLEKAEAKKETGQAAQEGLKGEEALDAAIGDDGEGDVDPEVTSGADDALEKAEAKKESSA